MLNRSASLVMSTIVLKALPGKLDIKRHSPSILYIFNQDCSDDRRRREADLSDNEEMDIVTTRIRVLPRITEQVIVPRSESTTLGNFRLILTLNAPIATKVVCFSRLLKYLRSLYGKQCGPKSDCSYRTSLFWVHPVCFYT